MKFKGQEMEIRPLDNLNTRKETQDMSDLNYISYRDLFNDLYKKIDNAENAADREESAERMQDIAKKIFSENESFSLRIFDSITRKKDLRDEILNITKEIDNRQLELFLILKEKTPELRESFKKDIHLFLENLGQKNNIEYNMERVEKLIENIGIKFFAYDVENTSNTIAFYNSTHFIGFNLDKKLEDFNYFKKVFYHEFLHLLTNNNEKIFSYKDKNNNEYNAGSQVLGLRFLGLKDEKFTWLNEAVTESLAIKLNNTENSKSYIKERKLLDLLNQKKKAGTKLNFDLLTKVYFRHIQKREEGDTSEVDEWREFSKEIDQAFGPRFLVKLDLFIEKNGIKQALEIVNSWPDGQPQIDDLNTGITEKKSD